MLGILGAIGSVVSIVAYVEYKRGQFILATRNRVTMKKARQIGWMDCPTPICVLASLISNSFYCLPNREIRHYSNVHRFNGVDTN